jgi:DNA-binding SARP family transcriptional activator/WD40 repeat protein
VDVRMLGPLELVIDDSPVAVGGPRIRRLLLSLLLAKGAVRSIDSLSDAVWADEEPPDGARRTLMSYVSRLRSGLPEGTVEQVEPGYRINTDALLVDSDEFERLLASGQQALRAGNATHAVAILDEALGLWRGEPLSEFAGEHWVQPERVRLTELRGSAIEDRFAAKLDLEEHGEILGDLEIAIAEFPDRERLRCIHMLGLYRAGRQTEALRQYQLFRERLAELGLEPSAELRDLERQILNHDSALSEPVLEPGTTVRGYRLGERIGEGAFGSIYLATQPSVGREVAVKVIRPEFANDIRFIRRFETEAQLVARLEHPHIVPLYDYWREPGGAYLVMRWLRGGTAEERLITDGPMSLAEVAQIVEQIGGALAAAHARGVTHRDVKPANILFDETGIAYLADFGIAFLDGGEAPESEMRSAGSPLYVSPEQIRDGETSSLSDVYSFGVMVYELLTGRAAFSADSVQELLQSKLRVPVPSVRLERVDVPTSVDAVIQRATAINPTDRFPDMGELMLAFRAAVAADASRLATTGGSSVDAIDERPRALASRTLIQVELEQVNPYKGLRAFQEADAQDFHGREALVGELAERISTQRLLAVVGASGSGKSSVVRAGLIPSVADKDWFVVTMVPGAHPLEELEAGLLRIAPGEVPGLLEQLRNPDRGLVRAVRRILPPDDSELLLVIDQFEEVFTTSTEEEGELLLDGLVEAISDDRSRIRVIVTIRADFYDRPLRHRDFGTLLQDNTVNVLPMAPGELEAAITGPAAGIGVRFEPGLSDAIISDVGENAAMLPLMQYALTELYDRREGAQLTLAQYREIGGVTGALARRAEELYQQSEPEGQAAIHRLFARLVTPGEGVEDTRRRAVRSELTMVSENIIDAFGGRRLLSFDRDPVTRAPTVEVAHEALIREWPRLRNWLDGDRDGLRVLRHLTAASKGWEEAGREAGELYRGSRLDSALEWAGLHAGDLSSDESAFLDASHELRSAEQREAADRAALRERQNRRLRRSLVGVGIFAVVALLASLFAFQQRGRASDRADDATEARAATETRRLISDAGQLAPTNRRVGLLLAAEAHHRDPGSASLGALQAVLSSSTTFLGYLGDRDFDDVVWMADGNILGVYPSGILVMTSSGETVMDIPLPGARLAAVRGDSRVAAVAASDSTVRIVDLPTGQPIVAPLAHGSPLAALAFSADGSTLVTGDRAGFIRGFDSEFNEIFVIDAHSDTATSVDLTDLPEDMAPPVAHEPLSFKLGVVDVAISEDGLHIASVGGISIRVWLLPGTEQVLDAPLSRVNSTGELTTVSPTAVGFMTVDGRTVVAGASPTSVELWSLDDTSMVDRWEFTGGIQARTTAASTEAAVFGSDVVVLVAADGRLRTASAEGSPHELLFDTQFGGELSIALNDAGNAAIVAGGGGAILLSLRGDGLISHSVTATDQQEWWVSTDGDVLMGSTVDLRRSDVWRLVANEFVPVSLPGNPGHFAYVGMPGTGSFDLETLMSYERDPNTLEILGEPYGPHSAVISVPSPDRRWMSIGAGFSEDPVLRIYDRSSHELVHVVEDFAIDGSSIHIKSIGFSPDSSRMVITSDTGAARVYEVGTWTLVEPVLSAGGGAVVQAQYTPDGRFLVTGAADGVITVRDPQSFQPDGNPLLGNTDGIEGFSQGPMFTDDSRWMTTTMDGALRLWDFEERRLVGKPFPETDEGITYSSSGAHYGVTLLDGRAVVWDLDVTNWPAIACRAAGRNLTADEWSQFGPAGEPYRATCPQWPSLSEDEQSGSDQGAER